MSSMRSVVVVLACLLAFVALASAESCSCSCYQYLSVKTQTIDSNCTSCDNNCRAYCDLIRGGTYRSSYCLGSCFPSIAIVELEDGIHKTMTDLKVGDKVLVGAAKYSEVYMFSHSDSDTVSTFIKLQTDAGVTLLISPDHYLYLNGKLSVAHNAQAGDSVEMRDGSHGTVVEVSTERHSGLYNPHTLQGDIVVNGIKTSSYTAVVAPTLAHTMLWPVRMLYTLGYDIVNGAFEEGSDLWTALAPRGRDAY